MMDAETPRMVLAPARARRSGPARRAPRHALPSALAITVLILAGCGAAGAGSGASPPPDDQPVLQRALAAWTDFPVSASPRPLIMLDGDDQVETPDAKQAAPGGFDWAAAVPPARFPTGPGEVGGLRLITARRAFDELTASPSGGTTSGAIVKVTSVTLGASSYPTDRGARRLPAWVFTFQDIAGVATVPAVAPAGIFPMPAPLRTPRGLAGVGGVQLHAGGVVLTVDTGGIPPGTGPCQARYGLQVEWSGTAVAIAVNERANATSSDLACALELRWIQFTIVLPSPVGGRVVVGPDAQAVAVTDG